MNRNRILVALVAVIVLAFTATALTAPAQASGDRVAKKPVPPKVGQCRTTTINQAFADSDSRKPVPCSKPHTMRTFAVATVPKRFNLHKPGSRAIGEWILKTCMPKFWKAQGGSYAARAQSVFTWWSFFPTKAEQKKGARWVRCDISLAGTRANGYAFMPKLPNVAFPMVGKRPITDTTRRCLATTDKLYSTPCAYPHVARADQTFVMPGTAFPTDKAVIAAGATTCPGKRVSISGPIAWSLGDHTVTCYSVTTS